MGKNKGKRKNILLIGFVVIIIGGAVYFVMHNDSANSTPTSNLVNTVQVVETANNLNANTLISGSDLKTVKIPATEAPVGSSSDTNVFVGQYLLINVPANTILTPKDLLHQLITVPNGTVAITIPFNQNIGVGGYITAGDHIDILMDLTGNGDVGYLIQNVPVLKMGTQGSSSSSTPTMLVVAVTPAQAEVLRLVQENTKANGPSIISYALRPVSQYNNNNYEQIPFATQGNLTTLLAHP